MLLSNIKVIIGPHHFIKLLSWSICLYNLKPGPDSSNDPIAIGSDTILWSWSADRIQQTLITIGSSDRENTKPNSLLPIESWHKSFTGKFMIVITWSWLNEKRQTDYIYSWITDCKSIRNLPLTSAVVSGMHLYKSQEVTEHLFDCDMNSLVFKNRQKIHSTDWQKNNGQWHVLDVLG